MLARKTVLIFANNLVGGMLGMASLYFLAKYMGPSPLGMVGYALGAVGITSFIGSLGFDTAHVKRVSEGKDLGDCLATFTWIRIGTSTLFALLVSGVALWFARVVGFTDTTYPIVAVMVTFYVLRLLRSIPQDTFDALRLSAKTQLIQFVEHLTRAPLVVLAALVYGYAAGAAVPLSGIFSTFESLLGTQKVLTAGQGGLLLAIAYVAAMFSSLLMGVFLLVHHRYPYGRFQPTLAREYFRFALPIMLASVVTVLATDVDKVMVGFFWSSTEVGYYFAAQRIAFLLIVIPNAVSILLFPQISELAAAGRQSDVARLVLSALRLSTLVVLLGAVFLLVYAPEGIGVFLGESFVSAAPVLRWLAIYIVLSMWSSIYVAVVAGYNRPRTIARYTLVATVINVILNSVLIPTSLVGIPMFGLGATGAAIGTMLSQAAALILYFRASSRLAGRPLISGSVATHLAVAAATGAGLYSARGFVMFGGFHHYWSFFLAGTVGTILYVGLMLATRGMSRSDLRMFVDMAHPGKMTTYIRDEISRKKD